MESKNLSELSERELEHKEKIMKNSLYFMVATVLISTPIVLISSYISRQFLWWALIFATCVPLYMVFQVKKQLNDIKAEFDRRRYR
jgi:Ca2+/Na+ antiporter